MSGLATSVNVQTTSAASPITVSPTHAQPSICPFSTVIPSLPQNVSFQISIQLSSTTWSVDLLNCASSVYVALSSNLTTSILTALKTVGNAKVEVLEFKPVEFRRVIAVLEVTVLSSQEKDMKTQLRTQMKNKKLWKLSVDPMLYLGSLFDVAFKVDSVCNDFAFDKGSSLREEFLKTIDVVMASHPRYIGVSVEAVKCSRELNITMVTARLQIADPSASNPHKELSSLKSQVDVGRVGNFSVFPQLKSYIPGEKLFNVLVVLETESTDTIQTEKELVIFIANTFKSVCDFRYGNAELIDNKTAVIKIGMGYSTPELPSLAFNPLSYDLAEGRFRNFQVVRDKIRVTIDSNSLTRKIFQVEFLQYVSKCFTVDITDPKSLHYRNLSQGIWQFIDRNIRAAHVTSQLYLETKVISMACRNATTVRGVSNVYMKPNAADDIYQSIGALFKCKNEPGIFEWGVKITLKTPTSPSTRGTWRLLQGVFIHLICPKRKPLTPSFGATPTAITGFPETNLTTPRLNANGKLIALCARLESYDTAACCCSI